MLLSDTDVDSPHTTIRNCPETLPLEIFFTAFTDFLSGGDGRPGGDVKTHDG